MLLWVQHRDTAAAEVQFRLDHERRMRAVTEELEPGSNLPQVRHDITVYLGQVYFTAEIWTLVGQSKAVRKTLFHFVQVELFSRK